MDAPKYADADADTGPHNLPTLMPLEGADEQGGEISVSRGFTDLAERAVRCTPGSCAAAVTLTDGRGGPVADAPEWPSAAVTHPDLSALMAAQWDAGEGPVPEALRTGAPVVVDDLLAETRWPGYRALALQRGLRGCATLPFRHEGAVLTVSVYAFRPYLLTDVVQDTGAELAELAAGVLGRDRRYRDALAEVEQLHFAMHSRPVVDQACGIVMAVEGCTSKDAFELLRTMSQRSNRKLSELAEALVRNRGRGIEEQLRKLRRARQQERG